VTIVVPAMNGLSINDALGRIEQEPDMNTKALLLAALVSEEFRSRGFEPVVVGGSAIEFYTDGAYMSGDTDICWKGGSLPTPRETLEVMARFPGAKGDVRSWKVAGLFVDLLGLVTTYAETDYSSLTTPLGVVVLQPVEDLMVERIFAARCWTGPNPEAEDCARKLVAAALRGGLATDWPEVRRIARLPAYLCTEAVENVISEMAIALGLPPP
jgi:hypothetical protein